MGSYQYRVYGLRVDSEIEIPELLAACEGDPDVIISLGQVPFELPKYNTKGIFYQAIKDDFIFRMDQVGAFRVSKAESIVIDPQRDGNTELMRVFLLGSVFGALLHQRGILALHGSAVSTNDGAMLIIGRSSSGKSSLAASLTKRSYPFFSDDISALHRNENGYLIHHGIPYMKLWRDVINKLEMDENLKQIRPSVEKFRKKVVEGFTHQPEIVKKIIVLGTKNTSGVEIKELYGLEKFEPLKENTYRYEFISGLQTTNSHFQSLSDLANVVRVFHVQRPSSPLMIDELTDAVIKKIIKSQ